MESDFVTRQHIESLTPHSDPHLAEVLNNYKFPPPAVPKPSPPQMGGMPMGVYPVMPSNNDMLLGNILGKMEAKLDGGNNNTLNGISFSLSSELLKWLILILILAVLIWIVLQFRKPRTNPVNRRLKKLERQLKKMRRHKRRKKNPKPLDLDEDEDEDDDFED
jgi:hypothetical protein